AAGDVRDQGRARQRRARHQRRRGAPGAPRRPGHPDLVRTDGGRRSGVVRAAGGLRRRRQPDRRSGVGSWCGARRIRAAERHADAITGISALSTVPAVLRELRVMLARYYPKLPKIVVEPGVRTGVPLLVDNPKEVGADRLANTLAAHHLHSTACVVVDFGTSTNVDAISARGEFLGGAFAPGIEISVDALASRAAALRKVELVPPRSVIGKNTVECLQSGILYGFAGQVDGLVKRIVKALTSAEPGPVAVLATGGLAPLVIEESETITEHVPDLTLLG